VADVAYRLECSSPQSFGRSMRGVLGVTPGEFRRRISFEVARDRFLTQLIEPYRLRWEVFRPLRQHGQ
jgi:AraC-like DNA-binding protein